MKKLMFLLFLLASAPSLNAQELSLSTNVADYLAGGTMNLEFAYGFARHWSVNAGAKYNPFSYGKGTEKYSLNSVLYLQEPVGGHGTFIPAGGLGRNFNTRNSMREATADLLQPRETATEAAYRRAIPECLASISISTSGLACGQVTAFIPYINVKLAVAA